MKYELNSLIGQITEADCEEVLAQLPDKCVDLVYFVKENRWVFR